MRLSAIKERVGLLADTHELDVTPEARGAFELVTADSTSLAVHVRTEGLMLGQVVIRVKVLVTLAAVVMLF